MGLSTADIREIKSIISGVFNEKFLSDVAERVAVLVGKKFEDQLKAQGKEITSLKENLSDLRAENRELRSMIEHQEQTMRSSNIRVFGVKTDLNENIYEKMLNLFNNKLNVHISNVDIKKCYRISQKMPSTKPPAVLVRFSTDIARLKVLKNRKLLKNTGVLIKEDLTKSRLTLFNKAISLFSNKNAWVSNGNILIKTSDGTIHRVTTDSELCDLNQQQ